MATPDDILNPTPPGPDDYSPVPYPMDAWFGPMAGAEQPQMDAYGGAPALTTPAPQVQLSPEEEAIMSQPPMSQEQLDATTLDGPVPTTPTLTPEEDAIMSLPPMSPEHLATQTLDGGPGDIPAPPSTGDPYVDQMAQARQKKSQAGYASANAQKEEAEYTAGAGVGAIREREVRDAEAQAALGESRAKADAASAEADLEGRALANTKVDPGRVWKNTNIFSEIALVMGAVLAAGATRGQGPNAGLEAINRMVDNDMKAQMEDLDTRKFGLTQKRSAIADMRAQGKDDYQIAMTYSAAKHELVKQTIDANRLKYQNRRIDAEADAMSAANDAQFIKEQEDHRRGLVQEDLAKKQFALSQYEAKTRRIAVADERAARQAKLLADEKEAAARAEADAIIEKEYGPGFSKLDPTERNQIRIRRQEEAAKQVRGLEFEDGVTDAQKLAKDGASATVIESKMAAANVATEKMLRMEQIQKELGDRWDPISGTWAGEFLEKGLPVAGHTMRRRNDLKREAEQLWGDVMTNKSIMQGQGVVRPNDEVIFSRGMPRPGELGASPEVFATARKGFTDAVNAEIEAHYGPGVAKRWSPTADKKAHAIGAQSESDKSKGGKSSSVRGGHFSKAEIAAREAALGRGKARPEPVIRTLPEPEGPY